MDAPTVTAQGRVIPATLEPADIGAMIDHSLLRPELAREELRIGCALAAERGAFAVCVKPADVLPAAALLADTPVRLGTVIGFPHGSSTTPVKRYEAQQAVRDGAVEVDMVVNIAALRDQESEYVLKDIEAVVKPSHEAGALVKVILENAYLTDEQIALGSKIVEQSGAEFVKTSTGYAPTGATVHDLLIMAASTSPTVGLKAAGGVRTLDRLLDLVAIGVTRFGATATASILDDARARADRLGEIVVPPAPADDGPTEALRY